MLSSLALRPSKDHMGWEKQSCKESMATGQYSNIEPGYFADSLKHWKKTYKHFGTNLILQSYLSVKIIMSV